MNEHLLGISKVEITFIRDVLVSASEGASLFDTEEELYQAIYIIDSILEEKEGEQQDE